MTDSYDDVSVIAEANRFLQDRKAALEVSLGKSKGAHIDREALTNSITKKAFRTLGGHGAGLVSGLQNRPKVSPSGKGSIHDLYAKFHDEVYGMLNDHLPHAPQATLANES